MIRINDYVVNSKAIWYIHNDIYTSRSRITQITLPSITPKIYLIVLVRPTHETALNEAGVRLERELDLIHVSPSYHRRDSAYHYMKLTLFFFLPDCRLVFVFKFYSSVSSFLSLHPFPPVSRRNLLRVFIVRVLKLWFLCVHRLFYDLWLWLLDGESRWKWPVIKDGVGVVAVVVKVTVIVWSTLLFFYFPTFLDPLYLLMLN